MIESEYSHDDATDQDTHLTSEDIGNVWGDWKSDDRTNGHDGREETDHSTIWVVEVVLPDIEGLKTVDHGTIVSVGGRGEDDEHQADVSLTKTWVLEPGDTWELAFRHAEGSLGWSLHCGGVVVVVIKVVVWCVMS